MQGDGIRDGRPRASGLGWAAGAGALWGVLGYGVLWEGVPFATDRRFVQSAPGTFALLPVKLVLGAIHLVEDRVAGHPFALAASNRWIGLLTGAVGAAIAVASFLLGRAAVRRARVRR